MVKKIIVSYALLQAFSLSCAESSLFSFIETRATAPLKEEQRFYEDRLRAKVLQLQGELSFDEEPEQKAQAILARDLHRFDEFRSNPGDDRYLMRVQQDKKVVALIVFAFNKKHPDKLVWIGPVALASDIDQRELWQACKEEARKRGGGSFVPGLNKKALVALVRSPYRSSEESSPDSVFIKDTSVGQDVERPQTALIRHGSLKSFQRPFAARIRTGSESGGGGQRGSCYDLLQQRLKTLPAPHQRHLVPCMAAGSSSSQNS